MTAPASLNIHATAITIGRHGLLFTGPSGSGKSLIAFTCLAAARRRKVPSFLVADDRVIVSHRASRLVASCPPSIAGLIEIRGTGILHLETVAEAELDLAVSVVSLPGSDRLPPEDESFPIPGIGSLPLLRLWQGSPDPLAILAAFAPRFGIELDF